MTCCDVLRVLQCGRACQGRLLVPWCSLRSRAVKANRRQHGLGRASAAWHRAENRINGPSDQELSRIVPSPSTKLGQRDGT